MNADFGYGADGMTGPVINPKEVNGKIIPSLSETEKCFLE